MKLDPNRILHLETLAARYSAETRGLQLEVDALEEDFSKLSLLSSQFEINVRRSAGAGAVGNVYIEDGDGEMHLTAPALSHEELAAVRSSIARQRASYGNQLRGAREAMERGRERLLEAIDRSQAATQLLAACRAHLDNHNTAVRT